MTFTNTDCAEKDWYWGWRKVAGQVKYQVSVQVSDHATDQVYEEINPIKYKISQDINK